MKDSIKLAWPWLIPWLLFLAALVAAVRNGYAAERDRNALKNAELEREKLRLEVHHLRNSAEARSERRQVYERLRSLLSEVIRDGNVSRDQFFVLGAIRHDSAFCFPPEIVEAINQLSIDFNAAYVAKQKMTLGPHQLGPVQWSELAESDAKAMVSISIFLQGMIDRFQPFLSHP